MRGANQSNFYTTRINIDAGVHPTSAGRTLGGAWLRREQPLLVEKNL